jgi:hypothetical protein
VSTARLSLPFPGVPSGGQTPEENSLSTSRLNAAAASPGVPGPGNACGPTAGPSRPLPDPLPSTAAAVCWDYGDDIEAEARKAAAIVVKKYAGVLAYDDLLQEARIWAATHPGTIAAHRADPAKGTSYAGWAMRSALAKLCEAERAHLAQYAPTDPGELPQRTATETDRDIAMRVAQTYADLPGPKGDAAREYLAYLRQEDEEAADLAEGRHLDEATRGAQWRCLACARKLPEDCGYMRKYCHRQCQRDYYRKRRQEARPVRDCGHCGEPIASHKRPHAVWCSDLCRDRARRQRDRAAA